jgi:hypothetical protein
LPSSRPIATYLALAVLALGVVAEPAGAGCGCTKPAPAPAPLRPAVAWAGSPLALFDDELVAGREYVVRFASDLVNQASYERARAALRRDLADGVEKLQIVVPAPVLPLGPVAVSVYDPLARRTILDLSDDAFTLAPQPVGIPSGVGQYRFERYRAAVSRDGVVYLSLDFTDIQDARVFEAQALGLALRFDNEDLAFWNVQGFLMQLLGEEMPGLYAIASASGPDSDRLRYSRHEFNTYFLQHEERLPHAVDPNDPNWHLDGTRHVDHDHQILEMAALLPDGTALPPGPTAPFTLVIREETFFQHGLVGAEQARVDNQAQVASYQPGDGSLGLNGNVLSNGTATVSGGAVVAGDVTASQIDVILPGLVLGDLVPLVAPISFLPVEVPSGLVELGDFVVAGRAALAPGSYHADKVEVINGGQLEIQNDTGPVTLYVSGDLKVSQDSRIATTSDDPERFAVYLHGDHVAEFAGNDGFFGVVYGPDALVKVDNGGVFRGAFVGRESEVKNGSRVLYDERLHHNPCTAELPSFDAAVEKVAPGEDLVLALPGGVIGLDLGLRIGGEDVPLSSVDGGVGVRVPYDLKTGEQIELALVDANGCRSRRTWIVTVEAPPRACGLFGIELALVSGLGFLARMPRRR